MEHLLDSNALACGWLAARTASSTNKDSPATNRTVQIESYGGLGVRLTSTDGQILISVWVPNVDAKTSKAPAKKPDRTVVAMDLDGRGNNLCGYLRSLVARQKDEDEPLTTILDTDSESMEAEILPGMAGRVVVFEHPGKERVDLQIFDGQFPDWRALLDKHKSTKTGQIDIGADLLGRLGKLGGLYPGTPVTFDLGGANKPVQFAVPEHHVTGLLMARPGR